MKEIYTSVTKIRRQVFAEVAKLAEHGDYSRIEEIPYKIIPGEIPTYRESVFKERAIVGERLRLALGLPLRAADDPAPISRGIEKCEEVRDVYEPPLINVIPFACDACDTKSFVVSDNCRSCLAHPCMSVCPAKAVSFVDGRSHIDRDKDVYKRQVRARSLPLRSRAGARRGRSLSTASILSRAWPISAIRARSSRIRPPQRTLSFRPVSYTHLDVYKRQGL